MKKILHTLVLLNSLLLSACGGGGGDSAAPAAGQEPPPIPVDAAASAAQRQVQRSYVALDGRQTVWYWEYLPRDYNTPGKTFPLLVFFHGIGESGNADGSELAKVLRHGPPKLIHADNEMCFDMPAGRQCFIVVSPQNGRARWDNDDTLGMLAHALHTYKIDPHRIYVTGLSMGGGATWSIATTTEAGTTPATYWAAKIAAAAPIAGSADARFFNTGICSGIVGQHLPVWAFHGDRDTTVLPALSQGWVDKINGRSTADGYSCNISANPQARLTMYTGVGHDSWTATYDPAREVEPGRNLYQWLLSNRRP